MFAQLEEQVSRFLRSSECAVVFSREDERLNRMAQGSRSFLPVTGGGVDFIGLLVKLHSGAILSASIERIRFGSEGQCLIALGIEPGGDQDNSFSEA